MMQPTLARRGFNSVKVRIVSPCWLQVSAAAAGEHLCPRLYQLESENEEPGLNREFEGLLLGCKQWITFHFIDVHVP